MASEDYVTYREMTEHQEALKKDILGQLGEVEQQVELVEDEVNELKVLVLPLVVSMKQTAENTKEISESLKEFTRTQTQTNVIFQEKFSSQALDIQAVKNIADGLTEKKKYNATVTVGIIGLISAFITGMFTLAPLMFP